MRLHTFMEPVDEVGLMGWTVSEDGVWTVYLYIKGRVHGVRGVHFEESIFEFMPDGLKGPKEIVIID